MVNILIEITRQKVHFFFLFSNKPTHLSLKNCSPKKELRQSLLSIIPFKFVRNRVNLNITMEYVRMFRMKGILTGTINVVSGGMIW